MKLLKNYYYECALLADYFLMDLYPKDRTLYEDAYWIADNIGEILSWGDWCVDMNEIVDYFRYKMTPDEFFDWYDEKQEEPHVNIKNYKLLKHTQNNK